MIFAKKVYYSEQRLAEEQAMRNFMEQFPTWGEKK